MENVKKMYVIAEEAAENKLEYQQAMLTRLFED